MRRIPRSLVLVPGVCLFVVVAVATSAADSIDFSSPRQNVFIELGPSKQKIHFWGDGKGTDTIDMELGPCNKHGICMLQGNATGPGKDHGEYVITMTQPITLTLKSGNWVAHHPGTDSFCFGRKCSLLAATLLMLRFSNAGDSHSFTLTFIFKATGGSLEKLFAHSSGDFIITLSGNEKGTNLARLLGTDKRMTENFPGGPLTTVPEPSSKALLTSAFGLFALLGVVRSKRSSLRIPASAASVCTVN
jgi:hypothetical protein